MGVDSILVSLFLSELLVCLLAGLDQCPQREEEEEEGKKGREGGREKKAVSIVCISLNVTAMPAFVTGK